LPLSVDGPSATVIFDNHWLGPSTRFSRTDISPFRYNLPNKDGVFIDVEDIRILLDQCKTAPSTVNDFIVDSAFIAELERLVEIRSNKAGIQKADARTSDYSQITNYKPGELFDADIHAQYINHIPIENLHGLTVDTIAEWHPGDAIVFDRTQLHCAASGHTRKIGISLFTNRLVPTDVVTNN
jgi:hypothetical protein